MKIFRLFKENLGFSIVVLLSAILLAASLGLYNNRNTNSHERLLELEIVRVEAYYQTQLSKIVHDISMLEIYVESNGDLVSQDGFDNFVDTQDINSNLYENFSIAIFSDDQSELVQQYLYPYTVDNIVIGYDLLADDRDYVIDAVNNAITTDKIVFNGPYELRQGYEGIVFRKAIYVDGQLYGMINIVANYSEINNELLINNSDIVTTSIYDENNEIIFGTNEYSDSLSYYSSIDINNLDWNIGINELEEFHNKYLENNIIVLGLAGILYTGALIVGVVIYLKNHKLIDQQVKLIFYDNLTKLPTRRKLKDDVEYFIDKEAKFFLGFGDLDNFKNLNDILGHSIGDIYLSDVASRFSSVTNDNLVIYRWGGDEFIFFIKEEDKAKAIEALDNIYNIFKEPILINDSKYKVSMSVGIVNYPQDGSTLDELIKKADIVMYDVKGHQKNQYAFFEDKYLDKLLREVDFENKLNEYSLSDFEVYLQAVVDVDTNEIVGFEALSRLFDDNNNIINTQELIKYYERNGKIQSLDFATFEKVCQYSIIIKETFNKENLFYTFNMSPLSLSHETITYFESIIKKYQLNPNNFVIEIIETIGFKDIKESTILLTRLRDIGFKIAMDDFGMGYSSLSYIAKLPLSIIKIDKTFIDNYAKNEFDRLLIYTINDISKSLNLKIIVEGIETIEQLDFIKGIKCHYYQGFYHSKPSSFEDTIKLLRSLS